MPHKEIDKRDVMYQEEIDFCGTKVLIGNSGCDPCFEIGFNKPDLKPYVMENVVGAPLLKPITLCGSMFGLDVRRHRLFESNIELEQPKCDHKVWKPNRYPGGRSRERGNARTLCRGTIEIGRWNIPLKTQQDGMGIDWIKNLRKLSESIPPAYTKFIGEQLIKVLNQPCT